MKADLILHNARVYTVDPARPWAEAVACAGGRIVAVGQDDDVLDLSSPRTEIIDAGGRLVLPGLIDGHVHLLWFATLRRGHEVNLYGVDSIKELRRRVRHAVESADPGHWVYGRGWDERLWDVQPARAHLDDVAPHTPVVLRRMDLHTSWANGAALARAGVTRETPDPPGSCLGRDADGELTGILHEFGATDLVEQHIPQPDAATLQAWLRDAIAEAHRLGLTGALDMRLANEGRESFRLLQALNRRGELDLRVHMAIAAESLTEAAALGLEPGFGDERLWTGHVKVFADGSMGGGTAHMLEPYDDAPDNAGIAVTPPDELCELARQADEAGFSLAVHAIGDRAVRDTIDAMAKFPREAETTHKLPHLIEHVQVIHPDDLPRLARHGIVASMQPVHVLSDWRTADRVWGRRARYAYAFRSLLDRGTHMSFGSDAPYEALNPMEGIYAAVARRDRSGEPESGWYPEERISVAEAVHGFTMGPAYASGRHGVQGSIALGKWADMIVLSRDVFQMPPDEIAQTEALLTIFDGRAVYRKE